MNKKSRNTKSLSRRLVVLLLCCVCLFTMTPMPAIAQDAAEEPVIGESIAELQPEDMGADTELEEQESQPETTTDADVLFERLMACSTFEEMEAAINALSEEEQALMDQFTEEQNAALEAKTKELGGYDAEPQADGKVPVHVYVSSRDSEGNSWRYNEEFQELIGLYVCDNNGYFPAGTIYLDESYFNNKANSDEEGVGLINNKPSDWETLLGLLSDMDNSNLNGTLGAQWTSNNKPLDFSSNNENRVSEYLSQAEEAYNYGWGQGHTALFRWHHEFSVNSDRDSHLGHYGDTTTKYHLDLCFNTNKITFICGNNGITQAISQVAYDGKEVDSRVYITGSEIKAPRNLQIPAGYQLVGYYTDPDFNTPWDGIGTPLNEDQTVYIKITEMANIVLNYKVAEGQGTVAPGNEAFNPGRETPNGSTAAPAEGWEFDGWYNDEACTDKVSEVESFIPTKPDSGWVSGTTYWAKFVPKTVKLTIKKIVTGNMSDQNKEFVFTVTGSSVADADTSFTLMHNEEKKITVKVGDTITITEDADGYTPSYQVGSEASVSGASVTYTVTTDANQNIVFTNNKNITIDGGVLLDTLPYVLILAIVAAGAVLFVKKRRHYEDH